MMDYLLAFSPAVLMGDFDGDGLLTAEDVDLLATEVCCAETTSLSFDLNADQQINILDIEELLASAGRWNGDADFDGRVLFADFVTMADSFGQDGRRWSQGDFNADGVVHFADFVVLADNFGKLSRANVAAMVSVPEGSLSPMAADDCYGALEKMSGTYQERMAPSSLKFLVGRGVNCSSAA